jgi:hypothetical protein
MNKTNTSSGFDSKWLGTAAGIFVPFISVLIFYSTNFAEVSIAYFITYSLQIKILPQLISLCVIPNLGLFFLFMWRNHLNAARGVIMATILLALIVLALKIFN